MSLLSQRLQTSTIHPICSSLAAVDEGSRQTLSWGLGIPRGYVPKQFVFFFELMVKALFLQYQLVQCFFSNINSTYW